MKQGIFHGPKDVRVEEVDEPTIEAPNDVLIEMVRSSVCGSDLWAYRGAHRIPEGVTFPAGHEITGRVVARGQDVSRLDIGDLIVVPFAIGCGRCDACAQGLATSCPEGTGVQGGQGQMLRVPHAEGCAWVVPPDTPEERLDSVHLLTDVLLTGYHAAVMAGVGDPWRDGSPIDTAVVVGDGAVGLSAVAASVLRGATTVVAVGHHTDRLAIAADLGATHTCDLRGEELIEAVRDMTGGGAQAVMECVGTEQALADALALCRPGATVGMVGVPMTTEVPLRRVFTNNLRLAAGVAPTQTYVAEVGPLVASGELDVSAIASDRFTLEELPAAYAAMDERRAIKSILTPS